jgi:hypothetical protein
MGIYHLEDKMKNAVSLSEIAGVYWSARDIDIDLLPVGNHHFFTFIYESEEQAIKFAKKWTIEYFSEENDNDLIVYYTNMGVGETPEEKMVINFNIKSDKKSIHEIAKEENTNAFSHDSDFQGHRIPYNPYNLSTLPTCASQEELMTAVLTRVFNFNDHVNGGDGIKYSFLDENCSCMVNSILEILGYSSKVRQELGEFWGIDCGEEDTIPRDYFEPMYYIGNLHTKRIHTTHCRWTRFIKPEYKVRFEFPLGNLINYDGCHYCLDRYDTD